MSYRVTRRMEKLLEEIIQVDGYVTSKSLSNRLGVSSRTIREDIRQLSSKLRRQDIELHAVSGRGYRISKNDQEKAAAYLHSIKSSPEKIPLIPADRIRFIVQELLFGKGNINPDNLADELFISRSTIEKDIQEVKKWFTAHELELITRKSQGIHLHGAEISIRYAMVDYFWNFYNLPTLSNQPVIQETIGEKYVKPVREILHGIHHKEKVDLSDTDYLNLLIYLSVSAARISDGKEIRQDFPEISSIQYAKEYEMAAVISACLENAIAVHFSQLEQAHLAKCLLHLDIRFGIGDNQQAGGPVELFGAFIRQVLGELKNRFRLDFQNDDQLIKSLAVYFNTLINDSQNKVFKKNPGLDEITKEYPDVFEMAVVAAGMIREEYAVALNEYEIGNIALYLCAAVERQKDLNNVGGKKIAIICATGSGGSQLLAVKVRRYFPQVRIAGIYPAFRLDEAIAHNPDLIISTIPLNDINCPVVQISHLLNEEDLQHIRRAVDEIHSSENTLALVELFHQEMFFSGIELERKEDVIRYLCDELEKLGYADDKFTCSVLERESVFSTAIGSLVAIPHAMTPVKSSSWIAVGILEKPIQWGQDTAQLILLLNIDNTIKDDFSGIYEKLYDKINSTVNINKLIGSIKFKDFMKAINE